MGLRRPLADGFLHFTGIATRARGKTFSLLAGGSFAGFGRNSVLQPPIRLGGVRRIRIGRDVYVGSGSWLQATRLCS